MRQTTMAVYKWSAASSMRRVHKATDGVLPLSTRGFYRIIGVNRQSLPGVDCASDL